VKPNERTTDSNLGKEKKVLERKRKLMCTVMLMHFKVATPIPHTSEAVKES
jgi:hypothetical protein